MNIPAVVPHAMRQIAFEASCILGANPVKGDNCYALKSGGLLKQSLELLRARSGLF